MRILFILIGLCVLITGCKKDQQGGGSKTDTYFKVFPDIPSEQANAVVADETGNVYSLWVRADNIAHTLLMKTDAKGNYSGITDIPFYMNEPFDFTGSDFYFIGLDTNFLMGGSPFYLVKSGLNGELKYSIDFGASFGIYQGKGNVNSMHCTRDNRVFVTGTAITRDSSFVSHVTSIAACFSTDGALLWHREFPDTTVASGVDTEDGGYLVVTNKQQLYKLDHDGNVQWLKANFAVGFPQRLYNCKNGSYMMQFVATSPGDLKYRMVGVSIDGNYTDSVDLIPDVTATAARRAVYLANTSVNTAGNVVVCMQMAINISSNLSSNRAAESYLFEITPDCKVKTLRRYGHPGLRMDLGGAWQAPDGQYLLVGGIDKKSTLNSLCPFLIRANPDLSY